MFMNHYHESKLTTSSYWSRNMQFRIDSQFKQTFCLCRRILTHNESFLTFRAPILCAVLHQNRIKIATVGARTDRQTEGRK